MELRSHGWSIMAAAREVGASRPAGHNWSRGYKTYRNGQVSGFVPALDRLAVREISGRFLSQDERIEIADLRHAGLSIRQVAARLGRAPSTISRELRRNTAASQGCRWSEPGPRRAVQVQLRRLSTASASLTSAAATACVALTWAPAKLAMAVSGSVCESPVASRWSAMSRY
jgi:lambda repressor-like predicted transcriptional regulator